MKNENRTKLDQLRVGQPVFDSAGNVLGHIVSVFRVRDGSNLEVSDEENDESQWLDLIGDIVEPDDARSMSLARQIWDVGCARVLGPGLRGVDQYILPHQIAAVGSDGVHLNIVMSTTGNSGDTDNKGE